MRAAEEEAVVVRVLGWRDAPEVALALHPDSVARAIVRGDYDGPRECFTPDEIKLRAAGRAARR
jgi:hypothetical protein